MLIDAIDTINEEEIEEELNKAKNELRLIEEALNEAKNELRLTEEAKESVNSAAALMPSKEEKIKDIVYEIYNLAYTTAQYETLHHQAHHMMNDGPVLADYVIKLLEVTK